MILSYEIGGLGEDRHRRLANRSGGARCGEYNATGHSCVKSNLTILYNIRQFCNILFTHKMTKESQRVEERLKKLLGKACGLSQSRIYFLFDEALRQIKQHGGK